MVVAGMAMEAGVGVGEGVMKVAVWTEAMQEG